MLTIVEPFQPLSAQKPLFYITIIKILICLDDEPVHLAVDAPVPSDSCDSLFGSLVTAYLHCLIATSTYLW